MTIELGAVLAGRYELVARLGRGGMGTVFRGHDTRLERDVAVKVLDAGLAADEQFLERFRREARAAASLQHHNLVGVFDSGQEDGAHYIVMEYVDGPTLQDVVRTQGPLEPARAVGLTAAIADGLGAAHRIGLVHRDVKPSNVLVTPDGVVKVTDFGIARAASDRTLTTVDTVLGSVPFVAPEQVEGGAARPASDVYALGCVLYVLLTGRPPFEADVAISVLHQHLNAVPEPPSVHRPDVSPELDELVLLMLAKDPADRPADGDTAAALLRDPASGGAEATAVLAMIPTEVIQRTQALQRPGTGDDRLTATPALVEGAPTHVMPVDGDRAAGAGGIAAGAAGGDGDRSVDDRPGRWTRGAVLALVLVAAAVLALLLRPDPGTAPAEAPTGSPSPDPATAPPAAEPEAPGAGALLGEIGDLIARERGRSMTDDAADKLAEKLAKVVQEYGEQDWAEARSKTQELRRELEKPVSEGHVEQPTAQRLVDAIDELDAWFQQAQTEGGGQGEGGGGQGEGGDGQGDGGGRQGDGGRGEGGGRGNDDEDDD